MLQLIILSTILACISAQWGSYNQGYGYNNYNRVYSGFNRGGLHSYNSEPHGSYGKGYGYSFAVKHKPIYKPVYHRQYLYVNQPIIKRLPPIYKYVKQPVYIEQPVIIRKIPVIKKTKPVTVKNLPPIIKHVESTTDVKTVDVNGVKYEMNVHEMPVMVVPKDQTPEFGMRIPKTEDNSDVMPEIDRKEETQKMHGLGNEAEMSNEMNRGMDGMMADRKPGPESETDNNGDFNGSDFDVY